MQLSNNSLNNKNYSNRFLKYDINKFDSLPELEKITIINQVNKIIRAYKRYVLKKNVIINIFLFIKNIGNKYLSMHKSIYE